MRPLRVFLDANILFSASWPTGCIVTLTEALRQRHTAITAQLAVEEARLNLARKQPGSLPGLEKALARVQIVPEHDYPHKLNLPANDSLLLGSAIVAQCTHFLSGDKRHFGALSGQKIFGVLVASPAILLQDPYFLE